jgi:hypothetical protein
MIEREPLRLYPYRATAPFLEADRKHVIDAAETLKNCVDIISKAETTIGVTTVYNMTIGAISKKSLGEFWGKFADLSGHNSTIINPRAAIF